MKYELIQDTGSQRYYKLEGIKIPLDDGCCRELKAEYEWVGADDYTDILCVSDAFTHIERLAFPARKVRNRVTNVIFPVRCFSVHIAGDMTFMMFGGDTASIYPDEWYIKEVYKKYGGENETENDSV